MTNDTRLPGSRRGFTLFELLTVMTMMGVVASMAIPRLRVSRYRIDAAAQQVRSVFQTAQRTSLTRQFDVIVSVDTIKGELRIAEDRNNNGAIEPSEWKFWRPSGEGNRFGVPVAGLHGIVTTSVVGGSLKSIDNLPSVIFHRDGSTSSDAGHASFASSLTSMRRPRIFRRRASRASNRYPRRR